MRFIKGDSLKDAIDLFHAAEKPGRDPGERILALQKLLSNRPGITSRFHTGSGTAR
jgi:hypothetical protein